MFVWHDLLGQPFRLPLSEGPGMNCFDVAMEISRRLHGEEVVVAHPLVATAEGDPWFDIVKVWENWDLVGRGVEDSAEVGDIVACGRGGVVKTVYTRVERVRPTYLTASKRTGVVTVSGKDIHNVVGVYRRKRA